MQVGPDVFVHRPRRAPCRLGHRGGRPGAGRRTPDGGGRPVHGSGAIAVRWSTRCPRPLVHAVELDEVAHGWAERNLVAARGWTCVRRMATAFGDLAGTVDVVTCNPPYIPLEAWESVAPEAETHDPHLACSPATTASMQAGAHRASRAAAAARGSGRRRARRPQGFSAPACSARPGAGARCATTPTSPASALPDRTTGH